MAAAFRTWIRWTHQIPHDLSHPRQREGGATSRHRPARVRICRHRELLSRSWLQEFGYSRDLVWESLAGRGTIETEDSQSADVGCTGCWRQRADEEGGRSGKKPKATARRKKKPTMPVKFDWQRRHCSQTLRNKRRSHSIKLPCRCTNPSQGRVHCRHRGLRMPFEKNGAF